MKLSKLIAERTKEAPSDAKMKSHILMTRAGYMKQMANGIYTLTSLGQKACLNIERIIRNEMNKYDGQEVKFPVVMPKELWELSGRYYSIGSEMARFNDRTNRPMLLGMTHEEAAVHLAKNWVTSYNQLPFMIYQIQTKFRDEPRSRAGLIRVREFTMKDAYSFHNTQEDLEDYYYKMHTAYENIYRKIGLKDVISVKSDSGMMGGNVAHEFMFLNEHGEDKLVLCDGCGYSANQEVAECIYQTTQNQEEMLPLQEVNTGDAKDIESVCKLLKIDANKTVKAVVYAVKGEQNTTVACFIRGDKEVSEAKLKKICKKDIVAYDAANDKNFTAGNIGPIGISKSCLVYFDASLKGLVNLVTGANKQLYHLINFNIERDYGKVEYFDLAKVEDGDICPNCKKHKIKLANGVEIGNIFQLGTKYTASMNMTIKTKDESDLHPIMGCYGIGVGRNLACVVDQHCDDKGIVMPMSIAPYKVHIAPIRIDDEQVSKVAYQIYDYLKANEIEVLIDDRDSMPGVKFADADLIGMPIRVVVSPRSLSNNQVEIKYRKSGETVLVDKDDICQQLINIIDNWVE